METAEFFADQSDAAYWAFVETWAAGTEPRDEAMKDEDPDAFFARCASRVRDVAAKVAGPDFRHGVLELSLGIRRYSPRLEMFRAVAREHAESISGEEPEADEASSRDGPACCLARAGNAFACVGATADGQKGVSITLTTEWTVRLVRHSRHRRAAEDAARSLSPIAPEDRSAPRLSD